MFRALASHLIQKTTHFMPNRLFVCFLWASLPLLSACEEPEVPGMKPFGQSAYIRVINFNNNSSYKGSTFEESTPLLFYIDNRINGIADSVSTYPIDRFGSPFLGISNVRTPGREINLDKAALGAASPYVWEKSAAIFPSSLNPDGTAATSASYFPTRSHRVEVGGVHNGIDWYKYARIAPGRHRFSFRPTQVKNIKKELTLPSGAIQTTTQSFQVEGNTTLQDTLLDLASGSATVLLIDPQGNLRVLSEPVDKVFKPGHSYLRLINVTPVGTAGSTLEPGIFNNANTEAVDVYLTKKTDDLGPEVPEMPVALNLRRNALPAQSGGSDYFEFDINDLVQSYNVLDTTVTSPTYTQTIRAFRANYQIKLRFYRSGESAATGAKPLAQLGQFLTFTGTEPRNQASGGAATYFYQLDTSPQGWQPTISTMFFNVIPNAGTPYSFDVGRVLIHLEPSNSLQLYR
jgi:hypothetical protein